MSFMQKILDALNVDNWKAESSKSNSIVETEYEFTIEKEQTINSLQAKIDTASELISAARNIDDKEEFYKRINEIKLLFSEFQKPVIKEKAQTDNAYDKYYENIQKQRENNLRIKYEDMKEYDMKPFNLNTRFVSDEHFTAIELMGNNLEIAYNCLKEINSLLSPHKHLYEDVDFPKEINTEYILSHKLPISHLRLMPYTATMRKSKYPLCLWLSDSKDYGTEYIYAIYFNKDGHIGQCELSLHGSDGIGISYETKIRRDEKGLYILRISKTLYSPPYGTTTIYHHKDNDSENDASFKQTPSVSKPKPKSNNMNKYDIERYARECNAYVVREDRKEK